MMGFWSEDVGDYSSCFYCGCPLDYHDHDDYDRCPSDDPTPVSVSPETDTDGGPATD